MASLTCHGTLALFTCSTMRRSLELSALALVAARKTKTNSKTMPVVVCDVFDVCVCECRVPESDWFRPCKNDIFYRFRVATDDDKRRRRPDRLLCQSKRTTAGRNETRVFILCYSDSLTLVIWRANIIDLPVRWCDVESTIRYRVLQSIGFAVA